jgi:hypothetical protein
MHYCGIIIKPKGLDVPTARQLFGDALVEKGVADWFSTDDYRERLFTNNRQVVSLEEFINEHWMNYKEYCCPICVLSTDYIEDCIIPSEFWEYYNFKEERNVLLETQHKLYLKAVNLWFTSLDVTKYDVTLLDYHN